MSEFVVIEAEDSVVRVGLNRPEKKNALTTEMYAALADALEKADETSGTRVVLLHGTQDCFTSGNDLMDFMSAAALDHSSPVVRFLRNISRAKTPLVAAVGGPAIGIGTTMLLHCDLVYAGENARFQLPFVDLGLTPEAASTFLLPQLVGHQRAAECLLTGEPFSAKAAHEMGLVNRVVPPEELLDFATEQATKLAAKPPAALAVTKSLLKQGHVKEVQEVIAAELEVFAERLQSEEAQQAFAAFFERRKPQLS